MGGSRGTGGSPHGFAWPRNLLCLALGAVCFVVSGPLMRTAHAAPAENCTVSTRLGLCGRSSKPAKPCKQNCKPCKTDACRERARARSEAEAARDVVVLPDPRIVAVEPARGVAGAPIRLTVEVPQVRDPFVDIDGDLAALHVIVIAVHVNVVSRPGAPTFESDFVRVDTALGPAPKRVVDASLVLPVTVVPEARGVIPITARVEWSALFATTDARPDAYLPAVHTTSATLDYPVIAARGVLAPSPRR
ncbi:MAG: hypothetical protein IT198_14735 [Acidimicrobiia bacterium]|nr:hypothetical protein [Acidimicrobiia bacterium]